MSAPDTRDERWFAVSTSRHVGRYALYTLIMAALIVLFVSAWLNVVTVNSFGESLDVSHRSLTISRDMARIVDLADQIEAPGQDVFMSRVPAREQQRLDARHAALLRALSAVRQDIIGAGPDLLDRLDTAVARASAAVASNERVLHTAARGDWDAAAMELEDATAAIRAMRSAFIELDGATAALQDAEFARNQQRLAGLERVRIVTALSLLAFVIGSAIVVRGFLSHAREQRLIAAAQDRALATAEYSADGVLISANENFLQMTRFGLEELVGRHHDTLLDESTSSGIDYRSFWDALRRGESQVRTFSRQVKNGSRIWTSASYYPISTRRGVVSKVVEYARDLTAEVQLDASRRALAAIVDASNDAIVGKSLDGVVTSWNAAAERLFGYTASEIVGQSDDKLLPPDGVTERSAVTARLLRGEAGSTYETRKFRKDGTSIVASISTFAVKDDVGSVVGIGEIVRDVTERRQSEAALQHLTQALHEHSIVTTIDVRGKITSVNDKFCEVTKYTREEVVGRNYRMVNSGHHPREFWQDLWTTIKAGRIWKGEICNQAKDGSLYWVESTIVPMRDESGTIVGFVSVRTDITERRRSAEMLAQAAREAEARNEELARANAEAMAATRAKSVFLASISHEMRTPLNAIVGMADLLAESRLQAHQEDYVRRLARASGSLLALVNDVLDLTKIEADQLVIESVSFDLYALLDDVSELLAMRVQEKQLCFVVFVHPDVPQMVIGDQTRLRQVIINLAGNAVKFTRHGQVLIRVEPVVDAFDHIRIRFAVSDTGIGIPADKQARVFESFTQVDASTTRKYGGTGLGLSISKRLVELMGGVLTLVSAPGCGSTFSFDLALNASREAAPAQSPAVARLRDKTVLLVDHQETSLLATQTMLSQAGLHSVVVSDGVKALAYLDEVHRSGTMPSLVLLEQELPSMTGIALAGAIRARAEWAMLPIVMFSAQRRPQFEARMRELCVTDHFTRPFTRRRLMAALARVEEGGADAAIGQLPAVSAVQAPLPPHPVRVLVVEDAEENREVVAMFLKGDRYQVDAAENGAVGVERFLEGEYDLVLMDMQMPIMDGYQATAAIRHWEREYQRAPVPIVAITANAFPEDVDRALAAGCTFHMSKPIRKAELLKMLAEQTTPSSDQAA